METKDKVGTLTAAQLAEHLQDAGEALEMLAGGESGLLHNADTAKSVAALLDVLQDIASLIEDETGRRFTRLTTTQIEDVVEGWFETADKVDARHGEEG